MRAYLDEPGDLAPVLYVERSGGALLDVLHEQLGAGAVSSYVLPDTAVELRVAADVVTELGDALSKRLAEMKMPKAVSRAIGEVLREHGEDDVEWWGA